MNKNKKTESTKVVIVGAGSVGSTAAYALMIKGIASEIVLVDINKKKCDGEVLDLQHGLSFAPQTKIKSGAYRDCRDADVVVITAGAPQKPGQSRLELAGINTKIVAQIVKNVVKETKEAIILVVTNPVDIMTYVALKVSNFSEKQVFGSGTTLDSSRFRYLLAQSLGVATESVGAYLMGEHGDSSVPIFSQANVMGENIKKIPKYKKRLAVQAYKKTRSAAADIICRKGATYYSIALAISDLVRAVLFDEKHVFPVSVLLKGEYGLKNICLSMPAVIGRQGAERKIEISLAPEEKKLLKKSASMIQQTMEEVS